MLNPHLGELLLLPHHPPRALHIMQIGSLLLEHDDIYTSSH